MQVVYVEELDNTRMCLCLFFVKCVVDLYEFLDQLLDINKLFMVELIQSLIFFMW